ncbi:MAG TPA: DUF2339 domain-containing protein [Gaiellaceae bacterium]
MSDELDTRVRKLQERIEALETSTSYRLRELRRELDELRREASAETAEPEPVWDPDVWVTPAEPAAERQPQEPQPLQPLRVRDLIPKQVPTLQAPAWEPPSFDLSTLLGARSLAWSGGVVTLLGVLFFFVLAVERGWIGQVARVSMGGAASLLVFGAGFWLHRRYGDSYASLAAVGAGIAGGYGTLLAAASLYDLLPAAPALVVAAAIAALATATALLWSSELVAGLGLVGAICVPAIVVFEGGLTPLGTAFAAFVLAGAIVVAVWKRWLLLLAAATVASAPQIAALVLDAEGRRYRVLVLLAVFSALYLGAGLAEHVRRGRGRLASLPASYAMGAALLSGYGAAVLFRGDAEGIALAVVAAVYVALAAALFRGDRDLSALLGAVGLAVGGITAAQLASGTGLAVAWAAEAAVLAWLARRIDDERYQVASLVYLALSVGHVLAIDAQPRDLFTDVAHPAHGVIAVVALGAAGLALAWRTYAWPPPAEAREGFWSAFSQALADLRAAQPTLRALGLVVAGLAGVYAASLGIVALVGSFDWAHVGVAGLWSLVAVAVVAAGARLGRRGVVVAGLVWTGACLALAVFDAAELGDAESVWAWLALGPGIAVATGIYQVLVSKRRLEIVAGLGVAAGWLLTLAAVDDHFGTGWLLAPAAVFVLAAAALRLRERDYATLLLAAGLIDLVIALVHFLDGSWLVLAVTAAAALLALLGRALDEPRLQIASGAYLAVALGHALAYEAPPRDLFVSQPHPGSGTQAIAIAAAGIAVLAWTLSGRLQRWTGVVAAVLPVYAASLAILELSISFGDRSLDSAFQRGHTGVSALWGLIGLALLTAGAARRRTALRLGGFALFGVALAKLFLFDLTFLSSITRAFSFLAVGAVLLAGGFLYQRLTGLDSADAR